MNAKSYDPRMEDLSVFISYPRSGSNWINSILELYLNRPRLRNGPVTFLPNKKTRTDFLWFHDHDIFSDLKLSHDNIIYLYRNPTNVIFSLLMAEIGYKNITNKIVKKQINLLNNHYIKYSKLAKVKISYEILKGKNYFSEFKKMILFLDPNNNLNKSKLDKAINRVRKIKIIEKEVDKRYFNKKLLTNEYNEQRKQFTNNFNSLILNSTRKYYELL